MLSVFSTLNAIVLNRRRVYGGRCLVGCISPWPVLVAAVSLAVVQADVPAVAPVALPLVSPPLALPRAHPCASVLASPYVRLFCRLLCPVCEPVVAEAAPTSGRRRGLIAVWRPVLTLRVLVAALLVIWR